MLKSKLIAVCVASAALAACGGNTQTQAPASCTYPAPDQAVAAPEWICAPAISAGVEMAAVGFADRSGAGASFMKNQAILDARTQLAAEMKTYVAQLVKNYTATTGKGDQETVDAAASSVAKQVTSADLAGSRLFRQINTPSGGMAVLVGMDPETVGKVAEKALTTSMNNQRALWQQFQADKAQEELAKEIANLSATAQ